MHCFTLKAGEEATRGIRIEVTDDPTETTCPGIAIGKKNGAFLPVSQDWFDRMVELDQKTFELMPELTGALSLPPVMNADVQEEAAGTEVREGGGIDMLTKCTLVSKSRGESDRRALVRLLPPDEGKVRYTGRYKVERISSTKVVRGYPELSDIVGVELLAEVDGEAVIIMQPGSSFRVARSRGHNPPFHMYQLSTTGARPHLIFLKPKVSENEAA